MDEIGQSGSTAPKDIGHGAAQGDESSSGRAADAAWARPGFTSGPDEALSPWRPDPGAPRPWGEPPAPRPDVFGPPVAPAAPPHNGAGAESAVVDHPGLLPLPTPDSAPPYPYEGDLEDAERAALSTPDPWVSRPGRHALEAPTPPAGLPRWSERGAPPGPREEGGIPLPGALPAAVERPVRSDQPPLMEPIPKERSAPIERPRPIGGQVPAEFRVQPGTEPMTFERPRKVSSPRPADGEWSSMSWRNPAPDDRPEKGYEPTRRQEPEAGSSSEDASDVTRPTPPHAGPEPIHGGPREPTQGGSRPSDPPSPPSAGRPFPSSDDTLPQRVPAEPDVPTVPEPPAVEPPAETPHLARIASHLRRDDVPTPSGRAESLDVQAILAAVREVPGVRDASLRTTPAGTHNLRLDLADGADPAEVSRRVARLLQERMGLAAAPRNLSPSEPEPPAPGTPPPGAPPAAPVEPEHPSRRRRARRVADEGDAAPQLGQATDPGAGGASGAGAQHPVTTGSAYAGTQLTTTEVAPPRPLNTGGRPGPRLVLDHVQVSTFGLDATVEVRLIAGERRAVGVATGPAVDGYILRLCAAAAASAVNELLRAADAGEQRRRCFVEHAAVVPFGTCEVATVVVLLVCDGWVEQLAGSALVSGDPRQAAVRATLAAVNRRVEGLLA